MIEAGPAPGTTGEPFPAGLWRQLDAEFELEREIGRGGMAAVWLAHRRRDGEAVAIKVLHPALARAMGVRRFLREIDIAAHTRSPHLVPLEGSGEFEGLPYYVMPYVDGASLRQRLLREPQLPVDEAVRIARGIAVGLVALHRDGIVHRDVKPENVLLRGGTEVLLADYGIARAITASVAAEEITSTGIVLGTPAYMSPEQSMGDAVDARSDQYAWGCILYEMLAGVPPFHGASSQAVLARHMHETPPSLRVVRSTVPEALEAVVLRAMGKSAADRFASVEALVEALDRVDLTDLRPTISRARVQARRRVALLAGTAVIAVAAYLYLTRPGPLDAGRVVVFPFTDPQPGHELETEQVTILVGSALERMEPTRWVDGWSLLKAEERSRPGGLPVGRARRLTRDQRARYFIDGSIVHEPAAIRIVVTLHDLEQRNDTSVQVVGPAGSAVADLGLNAVVGLLPRLTGLERVIDVSSLRGRNPAAVANWVRGEREYRQSRIRQAFEYLHRAVEGDPVLAAAALRGATAAMWLNREDTALALVTTALRHSETLAPRQAAFAAALRLVLVGNADSAVTTLRRVLELDGEWADAWMLTGETFLHLLPRIALNPNALRIVPPPTAWPLETWAEEAFKRALALDAGFTPPLAHLAEIAARRGDVAEFSRYADLLERASADSATLGVVALTRACLTRTARQVDWKREAARNPRMVYRLGVRLQAASDAGARGCARRAFTALLATDPGTNDEDWGSLMSLYAMLGAAGANDAALHLVDSAVAGGQSAPLGLFVVGAAAGIAPGQRADQFLSQLDAAMETRAAPSLWLLSLWSARTSDTARLRRVEAALERRKAAETGSRLDTLMARVTGAYLMLAQHDTTRALKGFAQLAPTATIAELQRSLWEPLAPERLQYARLLLATGDAAGAHRVASVFEQPGIAVFPLFLRQSLLLRDSAAHLLRDDRLASLAQARLRSLAEDSR